MAAMRTAMDDQDTMRENARRVIYEWIKDDAPLAAKMVLMPDHVEKLIDRILVAYLP
jgi:hypothetical protein